MAALEKKTQILDAARECFTRFGYNKTTLDDIGRLVGLNKASLYYYYKNKETIFSEVLLGEAAEFIDELRSRLKDMDSCQQKVVAYFSQRMSTFWSHMETWGLSEVNLAQMLPSFMETFEDFLNDELRFIAGHLAEGMKSGEIRPLDPMRAARAIFAMADGIKHSCLDKGGKPDLAGRLGPPPAEEMEFGLKLLFSGLKA